MIILIDNYDSFTYNLVHFLGDIGAETVVHRNDKISVSSQYQPEPRTQRWQDEAGMVEWWQTLAAGASTEFSAQHDIRYPQDMPISERQ